MPPKPKFTKSEIIDAAFEMTRENGIDSVVARAVGKKLGTSSSPIFTFFQNMEELKEEVQKLAQQRYRDYMQDIFDYTPAFKEFGMRYVRFAKEEPNLYRLLFISGKGMVNLLQQFQRSFEDILISLIQEVMTTMEVSEEDAKDLLNHMLIYINGISILTISGSIEFPEKIVSSSISKVCVGIIIADKLCDGTFDMKKAKVMADSSVKGIEVRKKQRGE